MVNDNNELQKRVIQELRTDERDVRVSGCETPTKRTNKQNQINYRNSDKKTNVQLESLIVHSLFRFDINTNLLR